MDTDEKKNHTKFENIPILSPTGVEKTLPANELTLKNDDIFFSFAIHFRFDFYSEIFSKIETNVLLDPTYGCYLHNSQYLNRRCDVFSCIAVYVYLVSAFFFFYFSFVLITPKYMSNVKLVQNLTAWCVHAFTVDTIRERQCDEQSQLWFACASRIYFDFSFRSP